MRPTISASHQPGRFPSKKGPKGWIVRTIVWGLMATVVLPIGIALLLPAVQVARESSRRTQAKNNLKLIGQGIQNFHNTYDMLPSTAIAGTLKPRAHSVSVTSEEPLNPSQFASFEEFIEAENARTPPRQIFGLLSDNNQAHHSWMSSLLPYVEQRELHQRIDFSVAWNAPQNRPAVTTSVPQYLNPGMKRLADSSFTAEGLATSHYAGNSQVLRPNRIVQLSDIKDGLPNTILAGEVVAGFRPWGYPDNVRDPAVGLGESAEQFGSPFRGMIQFLMCDGSVQIFSIDTDLATMQRLADPSDGQRHSEF